MNTHFLFLLSFSLLLLFQCTTTALAQSPAQPPAPAGPPNVIKILGKAGQFTTLIRLLRITQVDDQINTQLNSNQGLTIFAPTDNAFSGLQAGTLNSLTDQEKIQLIQFHIIPSFISTSQFQTVSNPLKTQAGDSNAWQFPLNVTTTGNSVNISTGINNATVANAIYSDNQLAVYQVEKVLLPWALFGPKPPAPAPSLPKKPKKPKKSDSVAKSPSSDDADASGAVGLSGHGLLVGFIVLVAGFYF